MCLLTAQGEYFSNNDTAQFATDVGYTTANTTISPIPNSRVIGTNRPSKPGVESSLDVQWMQAVNLEARTWYWIQDGMGWLYEFGSQILNVTNPVQVLSTSYGWWEGDQCAVDGSECQQLGLDSYGYTKAVNKLFQKIGLRGVSLLVASGDSGANSRTDDFCQTPQLRPEYPASSPYVTTVGATQIVNGSYSVPSAPAICQSETLSCLWNGTETAVSYGYAGFTSGGGFSNVSGATRPKYQDKVVSAYLASGVELPPDSYFNAAGRGEPDVAAVGHNGYIVVNGQASLVGGTSMSSPIFAAVITLLNEIALSQLDVPLGFLNPLLVSTPHTTTSALSFILPCLLLCRPVLTFTFCLLSVRVCVRLFSTRWPRRSRPLSMTSLWATTSAPSTAAGRSARASTPLPAGTQSADSALPTSPPWRRT